MEMSEKQLRDTLAVRTGLNRAGRRYIYNDRVEESCEKKFNFIVRDLKIQRIVDGDVGTISDGYLLYAVSMMGCASLLSVMEFLRTLKKTETALAIADMESEQARDSVSRRLQSLTNSGFLIKILYKVPGKKSAEDGMALYTMDDDSVRFMNQLLNKRVRVDSWMAVQPLLEKIGAGACACMGTWIASQGILLEYKQGFFKSKNLGMMHLPMELKLRGCTDASIYYVGICHAFLHMDKRRQTKRDYNNFCIQKINLITNYFSYRSMQDDGTNCRVVIVVEDNEDLVRMGNLIYSTEVLLEDLDRIFFVGEGLIDISSRKKLSDNIFLKMVEDNDAELRFDFVVDTPDFL